MRVGLTVADGGIVLGRLVNDERKNTRYYGAKSNNR